MGSSGWAEITAADVVHGVGVVSAAAIGFWSGYGYGETSFAYVPCSSISPDSIDAKHFNGNRHVAVRCVTQVCGVNIDSNTASIFESTALFVGFLILKNPPPAVNQHYLSFVVYK